MRAVFAVKPYGNVSEYRDKESLKRFLSDAYWAVITNNSELISEWSQWVYDTLEEFEFLRHEVESKPEMAAIVAGGIGGMLRSLSLIKGTLHDVESEFGDINVINVLAGVKHGIELLMFVHMAVLADIHDIKVYEGYHDGEHVLVVYFSENFPLESFISDALKHIKETGVVVKR